MATETTLGEDFPNLIVWLLTECSEANGQCQRNVAEHGHDYMSDGTATA
jgi:hypothetical protein